MSLELLSAIGHFGIIVAYVGLGLVFSTKFDSAAPTWQLKLFKTAALTFFVECAATHSDLLWHELAGVPVDFSSPLHLLITVPQAVSGLTALLLSLRFVSARIYDSHYYRDLIDRALDEQMQRLQATAEENLQ